MPEQGQPATPLQSLCGEADWLGAVEDSLDKIGSEEGELQRAGDIAEVDAGVARDGADGQVLAGMAVAGEPCSRLYQGTKQDWVWLRRRRRRVLKDNTQFRSSALQPQRCG